MLFDKSDRKANDRVIYTAKPNILFGCKKAIFGVILLIIILTLSSMAIRFVGNMQTYLISRINISLTSYTAIAFFVIILITVIYIIWQLIGWYSVEYMLTDTKIIIKSGVLSTKRNYMPYTTIQDLNTSQSIIARMFNVGSVSVFSAYDNNQMELKYINNPSEVEDMIFSRMGGYRNFQAPPQHIPHQPKRGYANDEGFFYEDYVEKDTYEEYYDEYEPITPINHEKNTSHRNESDIPPQNFKKTSNKSRHRYEYEPYNSGFNRVPNNNQNDNQYNRMPDDDYRNDNSSHNQYSRIPDDDYRNDYSSHNQYNRIPDEDYYSDDDYYENYSSHNEYTKSVEEKSHNDKENVDDLSEKAIERHFNKFKK